MTDQSGQSAQSGLLSWAQGTDQWIRWIVAEVVATRAPLGEAGIDEAYRRLLAEKGLSTDTFEPLPPVSEPEAGEGQSDPFLLRSLTGCEGVNALAPEQTIEFNPRMTVMFGENASGKSGYVRILKRLASGRSEEPILANIYSSASVVPRAKVRYSVAAEEFEFGWSNEAAVPPFTRIAIFDARAMSVHLESDLTYVFTPADLALFTHVHSAVDAVRAWAESAAAEARPKANPFLPRFQRGTVIYPHIETLGASTDLAALKMLASLPPDIDDELQKRRARVDALRPETAAARVELARRDRALYDSLERLCGDAETFDPDRYQAALASAQQASTRFQEVMTDALGTQAAGSSAVEMEAFIRAGDALLLARGIEVYPTDADDCIYCTQLLAPTAAAVVSARRAWIRDQSGTDRDEALSEAAATVAPFRHAALTSIAERLAEKTPSSGNAPPPVFVAAAELIEAINGVIEASRSYAPIQPDAVATAAAALRPLLLSANQEAREIVSALEVQESERTEAYNSERAELADLEAKAIMAALLPEIESYVERARWSDKLTTVLRPVTGTLRSLTESAKTASDEVLNQGFAEHFLREAEMLRTPRIRLEFPGRRGQAARRKVLVADHRLSEILSEGEQRVIALADFLAEASLRPGSSPLIFDDPVNSLDYKRLEYVVDRLVQLSEDQQVIVFTHNIWFAVELLGRFEKLPGACAYFDVARSETSTGVVTGGSHPRSDTVRHLKSEVNVLLQDAGTMSGESQAALIERAYDKIRAWCEVVVEEEVLQGVTKRYQPNVQMTNLPKIKTDRLAAVVSVLTEVFEKACRIMTGHSQPLETLAIRPNLDEVRKDWEAAQAARTAYLSD